MHTLVHIHLLLNHWPVIGSFIALGLFVIALIANSDDLKQTSLAVFALIALIAIPTYMSGDVAHEVLKSDKTLPENLIQVHQGAAFLALIFMGITGTFALMGLWQFSRSSRPAPRPVARWNSPVVLVFALIAVLLMSVAGNSGGAIHHPEILSSQDAPSAIGALGFKISSLTQYVVTDYSRWAWPVLETLHFIGLILIVAAIGGLNLRLLGLMPELPVAPLHRLLPWGIAGFGINIFTGMLFFVGMPYFYAFNTTMYLKMASIMVAGATLLLFYCTGAFQKWSTLRPGETPPAFARFLAATSLVLWFAIIVFGRYIPLTQDSLK